MKTSKYYLSVGAVETVPIQALEISQKQFKEIMKNCDLECKETAEYESPLEKKIEEVNDYENYTERKREYECGCYWLNITEFHCKKGYHFK